MTTSHFARWVIASLLSVSSLAYAADFKVGFVNTDRVLRESKLAARAQDRLELEFSPREKALTKMAQDLQTQSAAFAPKDLDGGAAERGTFVLRHRFDLRSRQRAFTHWRRVNDSVRGESFRGREWWLDWGNLAAVARSASPLLEEWVERGSNASHAGCGA